MSVNSPHHQVSISRRSFLSLSAAGFMAVSLGALYGCSGQSTGSQSQTAQATEKVLTDMLGNEVTVPIPVTNLFNAYPVNVGVMSMLGTTGCMNYVLPRIKDDRWAWLLEINPSLKELPTIGADGGASAEEVLSIEPDVVVVNNASKAEEYRNAGLTVYAITAKSSDAFMEAVHKTADLFDENVQSIADAYQKLFETNMDLVAKRTASLSADQRATVYYVSGKTPYVTETSGRGIEILTQLGCTFAFDVDMSGDKPAEATPEQLLSSDPSVIIVGNNTRATGYKALMEDTSLSSLAAVQQGKVYMTPQGIGSWDMYGPEYSLFPLWVGKTVYPQLFEDIDLAKELKSFYQEFFGYDLSDEYAQLMLSGATTPKKA